MARFASHLALAFTVVAAQACAGGDRASEPVPAISAAEIEEHTRVLSSDAFLGRGPGHEGGRMAARYIADAFEEYGLEAPGGSYLQPFPIIGATTDPGTASLSFAGPSGSVDATYLDDFVLNAGDPQAGGASGEAELVFVGYGIDAPEADWDDFGGVDVAGKYILILVNDPPAPATEPDLFGGVAMTYYGRWTYKYEEAARQGVLGALVVHETAPAGYPWSVVRGGFSGEQFALPSDAAAPAPAGLLGWVSLEVAREVLALGGHDFDDLKARAATRDFEAV